MKVNFGGQTQNLFLNIDTSHIEDLFNKKIAVVGSSGILLNTEYGELIDSHDVVVRFNAARVEGYEKHVGSRTDVRFMNGHAFNGSSDANRFKGHDPNFVTTLKNELIILKGWENAKQIAEGVMKTTPQNIVYFTNPAYSAYCNKLTGTEATTGMMGLFVLTMVTPNISCFGFNFHKDDWSTRHYWEEIKEYRQFHSFNREEQIFEQLENEGKIKMYK